MTVWVQAMTANFTGDSASVTAAPWLDVTVTLTFAPGDLAKSVTLTAVDNVTDDPNPVGTLQADVAETEAEAAATRVPGTADVLPPSSDG